MYVFGVIFFCGCDFFDENMKIRHGWLPVALFWQRAIYLSVRLYTHMTSLKST